MPRQEMTRSAGWGLRYNTGYTVIHTCDVRSTCIHEACPEEDPYADGEEGPLPPVPVGSHAGSHFQGGLQQRPVGGRQHHARREPETDDINHLHNCSRYMHTCQNICRPVTNLVSSRRRWLPRRKSAMAAPARVRPQVRVVPSSACTTGLWPSSIARSRGARPRVRTAPGSSSAPPAQDHNKAYICAAAALIREQLGDITCHHAEH